MVRDVETIVNTIEDNSKHNRSAKLNNINRTIATNIMLT